MKLKILLFISVLVFIFTDACAEEKKPRSGEGVKTLSGMSVVGNDEAPKALYLVPWKSSQIGDEITMEMPGRDYAPVVRDEFKRKVHYYKIQYGK